ncbi:MAG: DNA-processing protein DprA [Rickettsiales bacterium]|nr:DNA-processing protein DprA [Rickettsiales bacterium]
MTITTTGNPTLDCGALALQQKIEWIQLARSQNVGRSTFFRLIKIFGSAKHALEQLPNFALQGGSKQQIIIYSASDAQKELENSQKFGAEIILFCEEIYPKLLREIPDPPPLFTAKGKIDFLNNYKIAIVGPRNASFNGVIFAKKIAADLGENNLLTISGMARGIDAAAHQASLKTGTIAVIAGGINHIYPKENSELYHQISKQGLLVSESPFNAPPKGGNFIQRNRIISGMALGVVVVEASLRSGSLVTARFGVEQGREIFAVPGSPLDPRCLGTNRLIKQGAKLTENIEDILEEIAVLTSDFKDRKILQEPEEQEFISFVEKVPSDVEIKEIRQEILAKLGATPITIDEIIQETQASAKLVNIALVQLELADKITINFGKVVLKNFP